MRECDFSASGLRRALLAPILVGAALALGVPSASGGPDDGGAERVRLVEAAKANRWEEVRTQAEAFLAAHPDGRWAAEAAELGSEANWRLRRYEESLVYAERCLRIAPAGDRAERCALRRGETLFRLRRGPQARSALDAFLASHPSGPAGARARTLLRRIDPKETDVRGDVVLDYAGKYVGDPRLAARIDEVVRALPSARRRVRERMGLPPGEGPPLRVRFCDTGESRDGHYAVTAMELVGTALRSAVVIRTERLIVGYDVETVLTHELTHVQQQATLGERTDGRSTWATEGAAMWVAEQGPRRLRTDLWSVVTARDGAADPLLDGLRTKHRLRDYLEDWLAFAWIEETKGVDAARALCRRVAETSDVETAYAEAAGMPFADAQARARAWAEARVRAGLADADVCVAARQLVKERRYLDAVAAFDAILATTPEHPFAPFARLDRAIALAHARRFKEGLTELAAIERSPWADVLAGEALEQRFKIAVARKDLAGVEAVGARFLRDFSFSDPARLAAVRDSWTQAGGFPPPPDATPAEASEDDDAGDSDALGCGPETESPAPR